MKKISYAIGVLALISALFYFKGNEGSTCQTHPEEDPTIEDEIVFSMPDDQSDSPTDPTPVPAPIAAEGGMVTLLGDAGYQSLRGDGTFSAYTPPDRSYGSSYSTPDSTEWGAVSFLGEAGYRSLRGGGTYGTYFANCHRIKVSGEYLTQKLTFKHTNKAKWASMYAFGGEYQWLLPRSAFQNVDLGATYAHSIQKHGVASSDGVFTYAGTTVRVWKCGYLSANANYDYIKCYQKRGSNEVISGWGGSARLVQMFAQDFSFTLGTDIRRPFNYYEAAIDWNHFYTPVGISCGLFGSYTDGKKGLPNIATGGIRLSLSFGTRKENCCREVIDDCSARAFCDVSEWVAVSSVRVPVIPTVASTPKAAGPCAAPTSRGIPKFTVGIGPPTVYPVGYAFTSSEPLTFTISNDGGVPAAANLTIDPVTGVITVNFAPPMNTYTITVTATSRCGSTSQHITLDMG
jgi:hypothetical protein